MAKPTPPQVGFLENRGVPPPPTKAACSTLIDFVRQGNGTVGSDENARIALVKACQSQWIGKKVKIVRGVENGQGGEVLYILARRRDQVDLMRMSSSRDFRPQPFMAAVRLDSGKLLVASCSAIELL